MSKLQRTFTRAVAALKIVILSSRNHSETVILRLAASTTAQAALLSPSLLRKWRQKYLTKGKEGLKDSYPRVDHQLLSLEEENERLKRIVAKQALELEVKSE